MNFDPLNAKYAYNQQNLSQSQLKRAAAEDNTAIENTSSATTVDTTLTKEEQDVLDFIKDYTIGSSIGGNNIKTLINLLIAAKVTPTITYDTNGNATVEFGLNGKYYIFNSNEDIDTISTGNEDTSTESNDDKILNLLKEFASGNLTAVDFKKQLDNLKLGISYVHTGSVNSTTGGTYRYEITYNNEKYTVECDYFDAAGGKDNKTAITFDYNFINQLKSEYPDLDINNFFTISAWKGNDKVSGAMIYTLKANNLGIKSDWTVKQVGDVLMENNPSTELYKIIKEFTSGNLTAVDFKNKLDKLGISYVHTGSVNSTTGGTYRYELTYNNEKYTVECDYFNAVGGKDNKTATTFDTKFINQLKSEYPELDITDFFTISAWKGNNKESGAMIYTLKANNLGIKSDWTVKQVGDVLMENNPVDKLKNILVQFATGNLKPLEFKQQLEDLGIPKSDIIHTGSVNSTTGGTYHYEITYKGETYHVKCEYYAAVNGKDNNSVKIFSPSEIQTLKVYCENKGIKANIDLYFSKAVWKEGDKNSEYCVLSDMFKSYFGNPKSIIDIMEKIETVYNNTEGKINNAILKSNLNTLLSLNGKNGISLNITKDGDSYKVKILINGQEYKSINITGNENILEPLRTFTKTELLENCGLSEQDIEDYFEHDANTDTYKISNDKIKEKLGPLVKDSKSLSEELAGINTLAKLQKFFDDYAKYEKEQFRTKNFELDGVVKGYDTNAAINKEGEFRRTLVSLIKNGANSLYKQLVEYLGDDFESIYNEALQSVVDNKENYTTVKEAVDALLDFIYEKTKDNTSIAANNALDLSHEEKQFISEINPEKILGETYKTGSFDDIGDISNEVEDAISKLKSTVEAKFKALLGEDFDPDEFETFYESTLNSILDNYVSKTEPVAVKVVVNDFLKYMHVLYADHQKAVLTNFISKIKPEEAGTYDKTYSNVSTEKAVNTTVEKILDDNTLKTNILKYATDTLHINEDEAETLYNAAIQDVAEYYKDLIKDGAISLTGKEVIGKFIELINIRYNGDNVDKESKLHKAAGLDNIDAYTEVEETVNANNIEKTVKEMLNSEDIYNNLLSYATETLKFADNTFARLYKECVDETVKFFKGKGGAVKLSGIAVIDKFIELLGAKLNSTDPTDILKDIDLNTKIDGYKNNEKIEMFGIFPIIDFTLGILTKLANIKPELKAYIESKFGMSITDSQLQQLLRSMILTLLSEKKDELYTTSQGITFTIIIKGNTKNIIDAFMEKLPQYVNDHNPATKTFTKDDLTSFTNSDIESYFEVVSDGNYKLSSQLSTIFADWVKENGQIITLSELREAIKYKEKQELKPEFKTLADTIQSIKIDNISTMTNGTSSMHTEFGIDENGNIVFEQTTTTNVYNKMKFTLLDKLKSLYPNSYNKVKDYLDELIQTAWIMTYNTFPSSARYDTGEFIKKVLDNFEIILTNISKNEKLLDLYLDSRTYADESLVIGLTHYGTQDLWRAPYDYSNCEYINYRGDITKDPDSEGGRVHIENKEYDAKYQETMEALVNKLINKFCPSPFSETFFKANILPLFRQAQKEALETCKNDKPDCPYGTCSSSSLRNGASPYATANIDWSGTSRSGDSGWITMQALVQLTLYKFDKIFLEKLPELMNLASDSKESE